MQLKGRRILVTGAGSGIGRALAVEASRRGAIVGLCGRRLDRLRETFALLEPGRPHQVLAGDITADHDVDELLTAIREAWGGIDILVNNAGRIAAGPLQTMPSQAVAELFETNVVAQIRLTQRCMPLLLSGKGPRVVNIGSMLGEIPLPGFVAYSASKAAIKGFSIALRRELFQQGVAVTYAAPRATNTEGAAALGETLKGTRLDDPCRVASDLWNAVEADRDHLYPSLKERLFMAVQALVPKIIDRATAPRPAGAANPIHSSRSITNAQD